MTKPSNSVTMGRGMITIQRRLLREGNIERDDYRMFVPMIRMVQPTAMIFVGFGTDLVHGVSWGDSGMV